MRGGDKGEARKKVGSLKSSLMAQILLWRALNKYLVMWGAELKVDFTNCSMYRNCGIQLVSLGSSNSLSLLFTCSAAVSSVFNEKSPFWLGHLEVFGNS